MPLAMTPQQTKDFEEQGFIVLEEFFDQPELDRLLTAIDEVGDRIRAEKNLGPDDPFAVRNALAHHEAFLDLIDHPRVLPLVVDAIGWNIQIRTTHLDVRPPYPEDLKDRITGVGKAKTTRRDTATSAGIPTWRATTCSWRLPSMDAFRSWRSRSSTCSTT